MNDKNQLLSADADSCLNVGFIGLGMMGLPMLENLATRYKGNLLAFDASDAPFAQLSHHHQWGVKLKRAHSLSELSQCNVVITMLPNSAITNAVILGGESNEGLISFLSHGSIIIDMGSSNPTDTLRLNDELTSRGITLLDAPVSGAVTKAKTGTLTLMLGGDQAAQERVRTILETMGSTLLPTGAVGSAHAMKALNNYVYAAGLLAASEALLIAEKTGLDLNRFVEVLNASSGRNVATETKLTQFVLSKTFSGGFALRLQAKDIAGAVKLQQLANVDAQLLGLCHSVWQHAIEQMPPQADNTEIFRYLQEKNQAAEKAFD